MAARKKTITPEQALNHCLSRLVATKIPEKAFQGAATFECLADSLNKNQKELKQLGF